MYQITNFIHIQLHRRWYDFGNKEARVMLCRNWRISRLTMTEIRHISPIRRVHLGIYLRQKSVGSALYHMQTGVIGTSDKNRQAIESNRYVSDHKFYARSVLLAMIRFWKQKSMCHGMRNLQNLTVNDDFHQIRHISRIRRVHLGTYSLNQKSVVSRSVDYYGQSNIRLPDMTLLQRYYCNICRTLILLAS